MAAPLYNALLRHRALGRAAFHTPGHKGNFAGGALPGDLLTLDFTELPSTGSLFDDTGAFPEAEALAAQAFGAGRSLMSAGGCTLCIQTMLRLALPRGGRVLCGRNAHRAAVNAMALLGLSPLWAAQRDLLQAVETEPALGAVYVTSPDYYGRLADIAALAAACKCRGLPLLVDNAHGAHLIATTPALHPLRLGAGATACSAHKTLNVLTGGAWLHLSADFAAKTQEDAKNAMALFGSTSPSFPILASLDLAREWLQTQAAGAFAVLQARVAAMRGLAEERGFALAGVGDPTRLTLSTAALGLGAEALGGFFRERGVEPELCDGVGAVFICTPWSSEADFARLEASLRALPEGKPAPGLPLPPLPPVACTPREALLAPSEVVRLESAVGRVAACAACPCPPGVPVVMPGERITKECAEFLRGYGFFLVKVLL